MTQKNTTTKKATKAKKPAAWVPQNLRNPMAKADKPMSGLDAAAKVLSDAKAPMNAKAMVEAMLAKGLWTTKGATPQATIYAAVIREIAAKGDKSRFKKTDRGMFTANI